MKRLSTITPNTQPNRKLIKALLNRDESGVRAALAQGASANCRLRTFNSALLVSVLADFPQAVDLLVDAGADPGECPQPGEGRSPVIEAARQGRFDCFQALSNRLGGPTGIRDSRSPNHSPRLFQQLLPALLHGANSDPRLIDPLVTLARHAKTSSWWPAEIFWPWDRLVGCQRNSPDLIAALEDVFGFPQRDQVSRDLWLKLIDHALHGREHLLLDRVLDQTPPLWLLEPYAYASAVGGLWIGSPQDQVSSIQEPISLLDRFATSGNPDRLASLIRRIASDPIAQGKWLEHAPVILDYVAYHGSVPLWRVVRPALPKGWVDPHRDRMLFGLLSGRSNRVLPFLKALLKLGANPNALDPSGKTVLHCAVALHNGKHPDSIQQEGLLDVLDAAGAQWDTPDALGVTPAQEMMKKAHSSSRKTRDRSAWWLARLSHRALQVSVDGCSSSKRMRSPPRL